jgi:hypothetical protein
MSGIDMVQSWRWLEHAGSVALEDLFLFLITQSVHDPERSGFPSRQDRRGREFANEAPELAEGYLVGI